MNFFRMTPGEKLRLIILGIVLGAIIGYMAGR